MLIMAIGYVPYIAYGKSSVLVNCPVTLADPEL